MSSSIIGTSILTLPLSIDAGRITTGTLATTVVPDLNASKITTGKLSTDVGGTPTGSVIAFAGASAPGGYLLCDGSAVSRTEYADLFSVVGTIHGSGDGSTTFNLPDYRGRFLRGVAAGSSRDPNRTTRTASNPGGNTGDNVGSVQTDSIPSHTHSTPNHTHSLADGFGMHAHTGTGDYAMRQKSTTSWTPNLQQGGDSNSVLGTQTQGMQLGGNTTNSGASTTGSTATVTSGESRPENAYVNFIIKI